MTGNGSTTWTYNARGRLASAKLANAAVYNYGINGLGQRVSKSGTAVSTGRQIYVYDEAGHLVGEYNNAGAPFFEHVYLGDLPVAVIASNGTVFPVLSDHLGTPRQVINSAKQLRWRWDNVDPFGANLPNQNPAGLGAFVYNLRFSGQYFDSETGLHYNYFRDYNPGTGRYIESDPIGLKGGLNTYVYTLNNPLDQIDRFGLESCSLLYCFEKQLGFETGLGTGFVAGGAPLINKRFQTRGATGKTSIFSVTFGKMGKMPFRLPAPTYANPRAMTAFFGRFAGRWMPIIGWWMLAYDTYGFTECVLECKDGDCNDK